MNTIKAMVLAALMLLACGGCGPNVGYVIKPVPISEALQETVIASDEGLFVSDKVLVLDVDGLLVNQREMGLFSMGDNPVSLFVEKLDKAQADASIKAVVVRINSPGGGVTASDIMYRRLMDFRSARNVPVIAVIEDVGASGGYYIACGADRIIAHPTSVTGSIGTIVQTFSLAGAMSALRIEARAITSGPRKDMASPFKPLAPEDMAILQGMIDEYYQRFLDVVAAGRTQLTPEQIKPLADGRVFTGAQAKENGLVDQLGYMGDAIAQAKAASKAARVKVVMYHRPMGYRANAYSAAPDAPTQPQVNLVNISMPQMLSAAQPSFLYLWTGHSYR